MIRQKISGRKLAILNAKREERGCLVTGIRRMHGHNVSNSNVKTPKIFKQNISKQKMHIEDFGEVRVSISARGIRTIRKYGGLRQFLQNCKPRNMTLMAERLKRKVFGYNPQKNIEKVAEIAQTS